MGKRGPKGKSPELESAQGFPGRRKGRTKAALAADPAPVDIQAEAHDSRFVQPPPYLTGKRERAVWAEIMSGPNAVAWFKYSDHRVIVRYVHLTVAYERLTKVMPKPTYKNAQVVQGKVVGQSIKRNPAFDQVMTMSRELRSIEQLIAGNPSARVGLEKTGMAKPTGQPPQPDAKPNGGNRPSGPVGVLKAAAKMN